MSGRDEQPDKATPFPTCIHCGERMWSKGYESIEYITIGETDGNNGRICQWADDDITRTGASTSWRCAECGMAAELDQMPIIDEFAMTAAWLY